jgi:uncharacterized protein (DUF2235 family)
MAVHVVCLDGTDQLKDQRNPTNIARIFDCLGGTSAQAGNESWETRRPGVTGKYLPGVGSTGSLPLRVIGNLFGDGIAELIIRGYTYLSRSWSPGDTIIITGFSRGATAARALAGLIVNQGLLDPARYDPSNKDTSYNRAISAWYFYRKGQPDLANQLRLRFIRTALGQLPTLTARDFTAPPTIAAVGVFDTVSSLGLPHLDWSGNTVFDFMICDTTLSPKVQFGFHALAADENREFFSPTFWAARPGTVIQQIFPGSHRDVGGGVPERGLPDCALDWMLAHLSAVADIFDRARLGASFGPDPVAAAHDDSRIFPFLGTPTRARAFPKEAVPSETLKARLRHPAFILPGTRNPPYAPLGKYADGSHLC